MKLPLIVLSLSLLCGCGVPNDKGRNGNAANVANDAAGSQNSTMHDHSGAIPADCPLLVSFASYGAGTDMATRQAVEKLLAADDGVRGVEGYPWGREGEHALCVRVADDTVAARLFRQIKTLVPDNPRGPVSVSTRNGMQFDVPERSSGS